MKPLSTKTSEPKLRSRVYFDKFPASIYINTILNQSVHKDLFDIFVNVLMYLQLNRTNKHFV